MPDSSKPKIFISYSHVDEEWMKFVEKKLEARFQDDFEIWQDREIKLGEEWFDKIINAIHDTKIAILLISDDFLTSDFIAKEEIPRFTQLAREKQLKIVPVIIRSCAWKEYSWLSSVQGYPKDNKPLASFQVQNHLTFDKCPKVEVELTNLTERIKKEYKEEITNPNIPTDIELILEKIQNYLHQNKISINDLRQTAKKYLNDKVSQKNIDKQEILLDIISFLDGHDKRPLACVIYDIYHNTGVDNQEIRKWLDENFENIHCEQLKTDIQEQNEVPENRIIVEFETTDKKDEYNVYIRHYIGGYFTSSNDTVFKSIDVEDTEFQKDFVSKLYATEERIEHLDIFLPKQLLLINIKQWKVTNRKRLTKKFKINIHLRERAMVQAKQTLINLWNKKLEQFTIPIENALKHMESNEDEATKDTEEAGLMYLYLPSSCEDFYDDIFYTLISVRCGDSSKWKEYEIWWNNNKIAIKLNNLKSIIDHDDNKYITLIWDDPNIPLKGDGING